MQRYGATRVSDRREVARLVTRGFLPIIRDIEGFVDYYVVDGGNGVMVSTNFFEDPSGEQESNWRAKEFVGQHLVLLR